MKHFKSTDEFEKELMDFLGEEDFEKAKSHAIHAHGILLVYPESIWTDFLQELIYKEDEDFFFDDAFYWPDTPEGHDHWSNKSVRWTQRLRDAE